MEVNAQIHLFDAEIHGKMPIMQKRTIAEVLDNLMRLKGIGPTELSRRTKVDQSTISRIRLGKIAEPRDSHVSALAQFFGVSTEQLRGRAPLGNYTPDSIGALTARNNSSQKETALTSEALSNTAPGPEMVRLVPLISWVQAGKFCEAIDMFQPGDAEEWIPCYGNYSQSTYALRVRGSSMEDEFRDGEIVIVDPDARAESGSFVIARRTNQDDCTFKQLIIDGGEAYLKALNKDWPEPIIRIDEEWHICGVVRGKFKKY